MSLPGGFVAGYHVLERESVDAVWLRDKDVGAVVDEARVGSGLHEGQRHREDEPAAERRQQNQLPLLPALCQVTPEWPCRWGESMNGWIDG